VAQSVSGTAAFCSLEQSLVVWPAHGELHGQLSKDKHNDYEMVAQKLL